MDGWMNGWMDGEQVAMCPHHISHNNNNRVQLLSSLNTGLSLYIFSLWRKDAERRCHIYESSCGSNMLHVYHLDDMLFQILFSPQEGRNEGR